MENSFEILKQSLISLKKKYEDIIATKQTFITEKRWKYRNLTKVLFEERVQLIDDLLIEIDKQINLNNQKND